MSSATAGTARIIHTRIDAVREVARDTRLYELASVDAFEDSLEG